MRWSDGGRGSRRLKHGVALAGVMAAMWYSPLTAAQGLVKYDLLLGADYRRAQLDWNIAGDLTGNNPNVLSELTWRDLEIAQVSGAARVMIGNHFVVRGNAAYGETQSGENQDSDYLGDNRSFEFSRSINGTTGSISDVGIGFGYQFRVFDYSVRRYANITPMAGYSQHLQNLKMKDGVQTVPATGAFAGLDSSYDAEWTGPWLGLDLRLETSRRTALLVDLEYHWADYVGKANWNLRDDFAHPLSFEHRAKGNGIVAALAVAHDFSRNWGIVVRLESQHWETDPGTDTTYGVDNTGAVTPTTTRLNAAHWRSRTAGLAATYRF